MLKRLLNSFSDLVLTFSCQEFSLCQISLFLSFFSFSSNPSSLELDQEGQRFPFSFNRFTFAKAILPFKYQPKVALLSYDYTKLLSFE